jgi:fumarate hydratase class II
MPLPVVHALARVKKAAAVRQRHLGLLDARKAQAIQQARQEVLDGKHDAIPARRSGRPARARRAT